MANVLHEIESGLKAFSVVGVWHPYVGESNIRSLTLYQKRLLSVHSDTVGTSSIGLTTLQKGFMGQG